MRPVLLSTFGIAIPSYGACLIVTSACLFFLMHLRRPQSALAASEVFDLYIMALATPPLWYALQMVAGIEPPSLSTWPILMIGGIGFLLYLRVKRRPIAHTIDFILPYAAVGAGVQYLVGTFLAGSAFGLPTGLPWGIVPVPGTPAFAAYGSVPLHPTQLYHGVGFLCVAAALAVLRRRQRPAGEATLLGLLGMGSLYFLAASFRADQAPLLSALPISADAVMAATVAVSAGGCVLVRSLGRRRKRLAGASIVALLVVAATGAVVDGAWASPVLWPGAWAPAEEACRSPDLGPSATVSWCGGVDGFGQGRSRPPLLRRVADTAADTVKYYAMDSRLEIAISRDSIRLGEAVEVTITARNTSTVRLRGGITVSFGSLAVISGRDAQSRIYWKGDQVWKVDSSNVILDNAIVESWYDEWESGDSKTMRLSVIPLQPGILGVKIRDAFIYQTSPKIIVVDPVKGNARDEQGFPAREVYISVRESPDLIENIKNIVANLPENQEERIGRDIARMLKNQINNLSVKAVGQINLPEISSYMKPYILNIADLLEKEPKKSTYYLRRLSNNQKDDQALSYFGFPSAINDQRTAPPPLSERRATELVENNRSGLHLLSILDAEGDVKMYLENSGKRILVKVGNNKSYISVTDYLITDICKAVVSMKPNSRYVDVEEPMSRKSYKMLMLSQ